MLDAWLELQRSKHPEGQSTQAMRQHASRCGSHQPHASLHEWACACSRSSSQNAGHLRPHAAEGVQQGCSGCQPLRLFHLQGPLQGLRGHLCVLPALKVCEQHRCKEQCFIEFCCTSDDAHLLNEILFHGLSAYAAFWSLSYCCYCSC